MFHNSTTLHHFEDHTQLIGKENRMVNGIISSIGSGMWSLTKGAGSLAKRGAKATYYGLGGDIARDDTGKGIEKIKKGAHGVETIARTGPEATKNAGGMVGGPLLEVGIKAPLEIEKKLIIDNGRHSFRTVLAGVTAPFKSLAIQIKVLPKILRKTGRNIKNICFLRGRELASGIRETIGDILSPVKPEVDFLKEARATVKNIREAIFNVPLEAIFKKAPEKFKHYWNQFKNSYSTSKQKTEASHVRKDGLKAKRLQSLQEAKTQANV